MTYVRTFEAQIPPARYDEIPFTEAIILESAAGGGAYSAIETITLDPVDTDPADPATRNFTTAEAALSVGWYIIRWQDDDGVQFNSDPIEYFPNDDRTKLRQKIGDADETDQILTDDEVDLHLAAWPENVELAAADAAEAIAAKYSRGFNFSTDGQVFNRRERVIHYMDLADRLRKRGGTFEWPRT